MPQKGRENKWKGVHIDGVGDFEGLIGIEELHDYEIEQPILSNSVGTKLKRKKRQKKLSTKQEQDEEKPIDEKEVELVDTLPWTNIFVIDEIAKSLVEQGFMNPTEIQLKCIPAAVKGRRDILGAAETGSGKTLAFGIPMLQGILKCLEKGLSIEKSDEEDNYEPDVKSRKCVKVELLNSQARGGNLLGLVLAPTRELAIQVRNHLEIAAKYTSVKIATVVGGMSIDKQIRILKKRPHLLVATPGRLWELLSSEPDLVNLNQIRFFAIDETDRMLEKHHFPEIRALLEILNDNKKKVRQNFVFSATLTLVHEPPSYIKRKKPRKAQMTQHDKLNNLIKVIGMQDYKIVDITKKTGTAETLKEAKISCTFAEKDFYLYFLLKAFGGRTVIFCNSISCVRRLASLLTLLSCKPIPLHANMQQRQRLKNLDRFRKEENSTLLSTDVAARGLDIPDISNVYHYQVPRTTEGYVHRSGRTARAEKTGVTVLLIEPTEIKNYAKICRTLNREKDLGEFPVDLKLLHEAKACVKIAREIDAIERKVSKINSNNSWVEKSAFELDILLDDEQIPEKVESRDLKITKKLLKIKRKQLSNLLSKPCLDKGLAVDAISRKVKNKMKIPKFVK